MSSNITQWKTKRLENLRIPLDSFYKHHRKDWHPEEEYNRRKNELTLSIGEASITGKIEQENDIEILCVTNIDFCGECSGTGWDWILKFALENSLGILEATRIWDGGRSIDKLYVEDGKITETEIDV